MFWVFFSAMGALQTAPVPPWETNNHPSSHPAVQWSTLDDQGTEGSFIKRPSPTFFPLMSFFYKQSCQGEFSRLFIWAVYEIFVKLNSTFTGNYHRDPWGSSVHCSHVHKVQMLCSVAEVTVHACFAVSQCTANPEHWAMNVSPRWFVGNNNPSIIVVLGFTCGHGDCL